MCVPGSRMWQLRINWLNVFIHAAFVLLSVLLLGQQYYDFEWRMEVIREGSEHYNTSWNLTLTLGTFSELCLMGSVLSLPSGAATPRMPPVLHLTSSLSGGTPKKKRKKKSKLPPTVDTLSPAPPAAASSAPAADAPDASSKGKGKGKGKSAGSAKGKGKKTGNSDITARTNKQRLMDALLPRSFKPEHWNGTVVGRTRCPIS